MTKEVATEGDTNPSDATSHIVGRQTYVEDLAAVLRITF